MILNIDETWYNERAEKLQKVVCSRGNKMPYKIYGGQSDHITLTLCISADGRFLPTMFTFKGKVPASQECHELGPKDAIYSQSESGHIDAELYTQYIRHIEPFLGERRPIAIFQDNLSCHNNDELIDFCLSKQIHLFNIPAKSSHLVQPLDKLFGLLKRKIEEKKHDAMLVYQRAITKAKITNIVRFAISAIDQEDVKDAFKCSGIYPLDIQAIDSSLLVGDDHSPAPVATTSENLDPIEIPSTSTTPLVMDVFDAEGNVVSQSIKEKPISQGSQTDPVQSLPCSECCAKEVAVHPAVAARIVSIDMASVLIADASTTSESIRRKATKRSSMQGRWLTNETEVERRREKEEELKKREEEKKMRIEMREQKKNERREAARIRKVEREKEKVENMRKKEAISRAKKGLIKENGACAKCRRIPNNDEKSQCIICEIQYHKKCAFPPLESVATVCGICQLK